MYPSSYSLRSRTSMSVRDPPRREPAGGKPRGRCAVLRRGGRGKTWPCSQSTQNLSKPDLVGLDSVQDFGGRPTGRRPVTPRLAGSARARPRPTGRLAGAGARTSGPTGRFAGCAYRGCGRRRGLPTGRFAGVAGRPARLAALDAGARGSHGREDRALGLLEPRREGQDATMGGSGRRKRVGKGSRCACSFLLFSSHDRSDPTIDCDGASDAYGAPTRRYPRCIRDRGGAAPREQALEIRAIASDSRLVTPGTLFVAIPGLRADGRGFVADAVPAAPSPWWPSGPRDSAGRFDPADPRRERARGPVRSRRRLQRPSQPRLCVAGITGTDGKTTTATLLWHAWRAAGIAAASITTVDRRTGDRSSPTPRDRRPPRRRNCRPSCANPRRRVHARRARDVVARARDAPRRQRRVPSRRVHADHHGASRAARQSRPIPRCQGAPARARVAATRRRRRPRCGGRFGYPLLVTIPVARRITYTDLPGIAADLRADDIVAEPEAVHFTARTPWGEAEVRLAPRRELQRAQRACRAGGGVRHRGGVRCGGLEVWKPLRR